MAVLSGPLKATDENLREKEIPFYENLELVNSYLESEISRNSDTIKAEISFRINQFRLHFLFSKALENYSKFLFTGILEKDQPSVFDKLATQKAEFMP